MFGRLRVAQGLVTTHPCRRARCLSASGSRWSPGGLRILNRDNLTPSLGVQILLVWSLVALGFPLALRGQEPGELTVASVYAKSKTAQTVQEHTEIIDQCRQLQETNLSAENAAYIKRLLAFVQNRRGELYANQASEAQGKGQTEEAERLDGLALADFEAAVANDETRWKALHNRGVSYAVAGKYEQAVADFSRVVELKPDYANAWFNRAEIRYELGQYEQSLADYGQVIRLNPSDLAAYTSRGHAQFQLGRYSQALADYSRVVQLAPDNPDAYANRGDAYRSIGRWRQAADDYREAIQRDQQSSRAYQSAAWLMATCPDASYRNPELAVQAAQRASELQAEDDYRLLDTLAAAFANAGRFDEAQQTMAKALRLAPDTEAEVLQARLKLYEAGQPYRQPAPTRSSSNNARRASR